MSEIQKNFIGIVGTLVVVDLIYRLGYINGVTATAKAFVEKEREKKDE